MKIYLYLDNPTPDPETLAAPIHQSLTDFLASGDVNPKWVSLVNRSADSEGDPGVSRVGDWDLGLTVETSKQQYLKAPLNFLYRLAKKHEQEFVVGYFDDESGEPVNVCYFGFEEGRPDLFEIAHYLGLVK